MEKYKIPPVDDDKDEIWTIQPMKEMSYGVSLVNLTPDHELCVKPAVVPPYSNSLIVSSVNSVARTQVH